MKYIFLLFVIIAIIGMTMVEALPAPKPGPSIADELAHFADTVVSGFLD